VTEDVLAARLRAAREQAGLSQGQVAKLMKLHRPTISEIEAGRRRVVSEELTTFAKIYKVSVAWLMGEEGAGGDARVELAARELSKLKEDDLTRVLDLLQSLRKKGPRP
jgi:transcriptional regulator with XRE-family HTH domain